MIYGTLEIIGSSLRLPKLKRGRRLQQFPLTVSCFPPGTDCYDYFQFGRSNSKKNTFVFYDREFYRPKGTLNRVSRFSFRIQACPDTLTVKLLSTVVNDQDECVPVKNIKIKKFRDLLWTDLVSDCTLESGTIISTPGADFFWQDRQSIVNLSKQLHQLNKGIHKKLLKGKFDTSAMFHIDFKGDFYMLEPCHHILSIGSAEFWTNIGMPQVNNECITKCPFCEITIEDYPGYTLVAENPH